jgi:hypothetical protein
MLDETKLFDFIKIVFTKPSKYKTISNHNKKRHHFMINRFFSIKFPANAQAFNFNGINPAAVIDSWAAVATRFRGVPGWIYTKTKRTKKEIASAKSKYTEKDEVVKFYMQKNEIGVREFKELQQLFPKELDKNLKKLELSIQVIN